MSQLIYFVDNFLDAGGYNETQLDNWYLEALEDWQNEQREIYQRRKIMFHPERDDY